MTDGSEHPDGGAWSGLTFVPGGRAVKPIRREPPPAWLAEAVSVVMRDMKPASTLELVVGYRHEAEPENFGVVSFERSDGTLFGFGIPEDDTAELLVGLADGLQENLPESAELWGRALPQCPEHAHPARAFVTDGVASWLCPQSNALLAPIGSLARLS